MKKAALLLMIVLCLPTSSLPAQTVQAKYQPDDDRAVSAWLDQNLAGMLATYKHLHAHPELSLHEHMTAKLVAEALSRAGYEVTGGVGGTGVVGVLSNGSGPTVLIRGDMDALPVTEKTGLEYASTVKVDRPEGGKVGVMHACGHDVHTTALIGIARLLGESKERWRGTLVMIAQPAEEIGRGAQMMIDDGLFTRFPKPDLCISLHVSYKLPVGQIGYTPGWAAANVDSVDITIFGRGGHGARPNATVDPIVTAAALINNLQTLVSRRVDPVKPAVVTIGSIHGGSKHNIIPDEVKLQLTVRSYSDEVRKQLLDGIRQIAADTCRTFNCPKPPSVVLFDEFTPAAYNDPGLTRAAAGLLGEVFGRENVVEEPAEMGGEDFGRYAHHLKVPGLQIKIGSISRERHEASLRPDGPPLPSLHSDKYAPVPGPTLRSSVRAMSMLALSLLDAGG